MPKPVYIICSESGSEDKETGLLSLFNLIDTIQCNKNPPRGIPSTPTDPLAQLRVTSSWMREPGEEGKVFEFHVVGTFPGEDEQTLLKGEFIFSERFYRLTVKLLGLPPAKQNGVLSIEVRLRQLKNPSWKAQKTTLFVEVIDGAANAPATETPISDNTADASAR